MAKKRAKATKSAKSSRSAKSARSSPAEVEVVEESAGMGWEGGVAIVTTLILLVSWLLVDKQLGIYDSGVFFK